MCDVKHYNSCGDDGCDFLQKQNFKMALRKYRKALCYLDICWEQDAIDEGGAM